MKKAPASSITCIEGWPVVNLSIFGKMNGKVARHEDHLSDLRRARPARILLIKGRRTCADRPAADAAEAWDDYLHMRDNPAGVTRDLWYHEAGCGAWLVVTRNTVTHEVIGRGLLADRARQRGSRMRIDGKGLIDRRATVGFSFDGRDYHGFAGDTLASALLANGVRLVGASFKYHRPRGVMTAGSEEPNALVTVGAGAQAGSPTCAPPCRRFTTGWRRAARTAGPRWRYDMMAVNDLAVAVPGGGVLLQDLHVAARLLGKAL